jgi:hypothetical protein
VTIVQILTDIDNQDAPECLLHGFWDVLLRVSAFSTRNGYGFGTAVHDRSQHKHLAKTIYAVGEGARFSPITKANVVASDCSSVEQASIH